MDSDMRRRRVRHQTAPYRAKAFPAWSLVISSKTGVEWNSSDSRFTQKGNTLYAFQMRWPEDHRAVIRTLSPTDQVQSVRLLGVGEVPFEQPYGALIVSLP